MLHSLASNLLGGSSETGWEDIPFELLEGEEGWALAKYAELQKNITLYPHQQAAVARALNQKSLLLAHGVGTGKTLSSIAFAEETHKRTGRPALVITPAGLRTNFVSNVARFSNSSYEVIETERELAQLVAANSRGRKLPNYLVVSWDMLRKVPETMRGLGPGTIIFDEIHHARNPLTANFKAARVVRSGVPYTVGLTGSVVSNTPDDLPPLLSIVTDGKVPERMRLKQQVTEPFSYFRDILGKERQMRVVSKPDIIRSLGEHVDFLRSEDLGNAIPRAVTEYVPVEMSGPQYDLYTKQLSALPSSWSDRIIRGQWKNDSAGRQILTRITGARQAAQSTVGAYPDARQVLKTSPKVRKLVTDAREHLQESKGNQVVVYTNFVGAGVAPIHSAFAAMGIPHSIFVGPGKEVGDTKISAMGRQRGVEDFLAGKTRAIILSGAGAEGLDLKNGTMFQAAEGHFNPEIIRQAQARVQRLGAQMDKPPEQRRVIVKRYVSVEPYPGFMRRIWRSVTGKPAHYKSTDEWMYDVAKGKHLTNEGVRIALRGRVPLRPGEEALPMNMLLNHPVKYARRWRNIQTGRIRYEYTSSL